MQASSQRVKGSGTDTVQLGLANKGLFFPFCQYLSSLLLLKHMLLQCSAFGCACVEGRTVCVCELEHRSQAVVGALFQA